MDTSTKQADEQANLMHEVNAAVRGLGDERDVMISSLCNRIAINRGFYDGQTPVLMMFKHIAHLLDEIIEFYRECDVLQSDSEFVALELADCSILLFDLAQLSGCPLTYADLTWEQSYQEDENSAWELILGLGKIAKQFYKRGSIDREILIDFANSVNRRGQRFSDGYFKRVILYKCKANLSRPYRYGTAHQEEHIGKSKDIYKNKVEYGSSLTSGIPSNGTHSLP